MLLCHAVASHMATVLMCTSHADKATDLILMMHAGTVVLSTVLLPDS